MNAVQIPSGFRFERLHRDHPRKSFRSGQDPVDDWLASKALQNQEKHLSVTKLLIERSSEIVGYYTLATGQVDFGDLPAEITKRLPRRMLVRLVNCCMRSATRLPRGRSCWRLRRAGSSRVKNVARTAKRAGPSPLARGRERGRG